MNNTDIQEERILPYASTTRQQVVQVLVVGLVAGLIAWGLASLLEAYVLKALLCPGGAVACTAATEYAGRISAIFAAAFGLFSLIKLQVFRPLLVVLAATISLWEVVQLVGSFPLQWAAVSMVLISGIAYSIFTWIARIRMFATALILMLVLVVIVRLMLFS